tara:strand:+ start:65 stop:454 length:390 start_codon:yes stop_codon:yes gene_type:complete
MSDLFKKCRYCHKEYPESFFGAARTTEKKTYRRHKCRFCYRNTKKKLQKTYRNIIWMYKKERGCCHCGVIDPRVLDFHHRDTKDFSIAEQSKRGYGKQRLLEEMEKCDILCANCHRIEHFQNKEKKDRL